MRALKMHGGGPPVTAGKPLDAAYRTADVDLVKVRSLNPKLRYSLVHSFKRGGCSAESEGFP